MADGVRSKQPHHRLVLSPLRRLASPCEGDGGLGGCRSGLRLENGILGWAAGQARPGHMPLCRGMVYSHPYLQSCRKMGKSDLQVRTIAKKEDKM
nr:hypothetical protein Iba_chr07cCG6680 [Ipomoea batatas]